jgi:hypothetical protein
MAKATKRKGRSAQERALRQVLGDALYEQIREAAEEQSAKTKPRRGAAAKSPREAVSPDELADQIAARLEKELKLARPVYSVILRQCSSVIVHQVRE